MILFGVELGGLPHNATTPITSGGSSGSSSGGLSSEYTIGDDVTVQSNNEPDEEGRRMGIRMVLKNGGSEESIYHEDAQSFDSLRNRLRDMMGWNLDEAELTFELNDSEACSLRGEADFRNMILLCGVLNLKQVTIRRLEHSPTQTNKRKSTEQSYIPQYWTASKPNPTTPYRPPYIFRDRVCTDVGLHRDPISDDGNESGKRKFQLPDSMFEDPYYPPSDLGAPKKTKTKRQLREERHARGEFYTGATSSIPVFEFNPDTEAHALRSAIWTSYLTGTGQEFRGGMEEFRIKLIKYAAKLGFRYRFIKNNATYLRAVCHYNESHGCDWFVKGSVSSVTETLFLKDCNLVHTCPMSMLRNDSKRLGQKALSTLILDAVTAHPAITASILKSEILRAWGFEVTYEKVWRGLEVARATVFGGYNESFDELRWYTDAIKKTNPGSITILDTERETNRFTRLFFSFAASIHGFQTCRPMLFVDGTFMKTRFKGTLLSATAKDGNNGLFPVALAIVDSENKENWGWFIEKIKETVSHDSDIMFVSDRAGGLMHTFDAIKTKSVHFFCLFHLMKNLRGMYGGKKYSEVFKSHLCKLLKDAAYAPNKRCFDQAIAIFIDRGGANAVHFLKDLPPEKWAVAFASNVHRYGDLTSNAAESFNSWVFDARSLPITVMLDVIRQQLMKWFNDRRTEHSRWTGALTPTMELLWNKESAKGENWTIQPSNVHGQLEVLTIPTCVGFPCSHAIACINRSHWDIREVVEAYFFVNYYRDTYAGNIEPVPTTGKFEFIDLNNTPTVEPPVVKRAAGRPKNKRFRSRSEAKGGRFLCGRCGKYGTHYWTTCQNAIKQNP